MILLDTDTLTHFSYGKNDRLREQIENAPGDDLLAVALISRIEILRGRADNLLKAANEEELEKAAERFRKAEEMLSSFKLVGFDEAAINHFGHSRKQSNLKKMGRADMLIACIALAHDALLVTRNTKDYKNVAGLRIDNWVD
jgi:tRNA(fMet)-specific endonuclease VapC